MSQDQMSPQHLLDEGRWEEAIRAWMRPIPVSVLGLQLAEQLLNTQPLAENHLLQTISHWYRQPEETLRWEIFEQAKEVGFSTPSGALALSLFWSHGSLSPAGLEPVYPDPQLSAQMLHCSLVLHVAHLADTPVEGVRQWLTQTTI